MIVTQNEYCLSSCVRFLGFWLWPWVFPPIACAWFQVFGCITECLVPLTNLPWFYEVNSSSYRMPLGCSIVTRNSSSIWSTLYCYWSRARFQGDFSEQQRLIVPRSHCILQLIELGTRLFVNWLIPPSNRGELAVFGRILWYCLWSVGSIPGFCL